MCKGLAMYSLGLTYWMGIFQSKHKFLTVKVPLCHWLIVSYHNTALASSHHPPPSRQDQCDVTGFLTHPAE